MRKVRIAELKARLSACLRAVRQGETILVLDRDTPVARIVPANSAVLRVRKPAPRAPALSQVKLPPPLGLDRDIVELLRDERQADR